MLFASELVRLAPTLFVWQAYDSQTKTDLFSAAVRTSEGLYLVDPIALREECLSELLNSGPVSGIILTNANHLRAAPRFAAQFSAPVFARSGALPNESGLNLKDVGDGDEICGELGVLEIDGAATGEIVLCHRPDQGTLIFGDALINFEPYGFTFLPPKYCSNPKELRRSLHKLLRHPAERMLFAHGVPILSGATVRLRQLLDGDGK